MQGSEQYVLEVTKSGSGLVDPDVGSHVYVEDQVVNITATPDPCWEFTGWTGTGTPAVANPGSPNTTITMNDDYSIQANFILDTSTLTMADDGNGTTIPASGVHGPYDCGTEVAVNAIPDVCYEFVEWTGDTAYLNISKPAPFATISGLNITSDISTESEAKIK